jgi:uncharacterized protein (DUF4213/DUF364 family)
LIECACRLRIACLFFSPEPLISNMAFIDELLNTVGDGLVQDVRVGTHWTAVVVNDAGQLRCGLAATLCGAHHGGGPSVRDAGHLLDRTAGELAAMILSDRPTEAAIGMATINALLPQREEAWTDLNAETVLAHHGAGKRVAMVGHFPFVARLRERVETLWVLELHPGDGDLPAEAAPDVIPQADLLAITGTTLLNGTFEELISLRQPHALVMVLGPSTPLSPILFTYGVHWLSGSVVTDIPAVLAAVGQGANFRQVHRQGVRLVTLQNLS